MKNKTIENKPCIMVKYSERSTLAVVLVRALEPITPDTYKFQGEVTESNHIQYRVGTTDTWRLHDIDGWSLEFI